MWWPGTFSTPAVRRCGAAVSGHIAGVGGADAEIGLSVGGCCVRLLTSAQLSLLTWDGAGWGGGGASGQAGHERPQGPIATSAVPNPDAVQLSYGTYRFSSPEISLNYMDKSTYSSILYTSFTHPWSRYFGCGRIDVVKHIYSTGLRHLVTPQRPTLSRSHRKILIGLFSQTF